VTATSDIQLVAGPEARLAAGNWRLIPADSYATFAARLPFRRVHGRLPLAGQVLITERVEASRAVLTASTRAVSTGVTALDRVLAGPAFLDAHAYPDIRFTSDLLVWVPSGWRAVGRLQVKNAEHEVACQFEVQFGDATPGSAPRPVVTGRWVLDSTWVASQRIPGLDRRIEMTCSFQLATDRHGDNSSEHCDVHRTELASSS
jgi:polyisoprenoid-binding protein YceI